MKAQTEIIVYAIILTTAVSLTAVSYLWISGSLSNMRAGVETSTSQELLRSKACLKIDSVKTADNKIVIINCGSVPLSKFSLYIDETITTIADPGMLKPMETKEISVALPTGMHTVKIYSDYARAYSSYIILNVLISGGFETC